MMCIGRNHSDKSAERYYDFLRSVNNEEFRKEFREKYPDTRRGDYWSGKSREEKMKTWIKTWTKNAWLDR